MITPLDKARLVSFISGESLDKVRLYQESVACDEALLKVYLKRMEHGESIGRITGRRWFWKDEFLIEGVLEPRADSETVVEAVLLLFPDKSLPLTFLDIGTGSGCLLLSLLREYPNARGTGIDMSKQALATAKKNAEKLGLEKASFIHCDFRESLPGQGYDIVISNPPYVRKEEIKDLEGTVKDFDPLSALDGGEDGLEAYRSIFSHLPPCSFFVTEIGRGQETYVGEIAERYGYRIVMSRKDLSGIERALVFCG